MSRFYVTEVLVGPLPNGLTVINDTPLDALHTEIADLAHCASPLGLDVSVSGRIATGIELHLEPGEEGPKRHEQARDILASRIELWLGDNWRVYYYADKLLNDLDAAGLGIFPCDAEGNPYLPGHQADHVGGQ